jgi:hypothetical protein
MRNVPLAAVFVAALVLGSACGGGPPELQAQVVLSSALHGPTESIGVWVFGPIRSDDVQVTCNSLRADTAQHLEPTDERLEVLGHADRAVDGSETQTLTLDEVAAGEDRFVYVAAYDGVEQLIGDGCTDTVTVRSGAVVEVRVQVHPL